MESEVMSIRIRKGTAARLKKLGINSSSRVKAYLENLAWRAGAKRAIDELEIIVKKNSKPSKTGFAVESVREDRYATH